MRLPRVLAPLVILLFARLSSSGAETPLPFVMRPAFGSLTFEQPVAIVTPPGETDRIFVLEKPGRIIVVNHLAQPTRSVFLDLTKRVGDDESEQGVLALAFHPDYAHNHQFYVWYTSCHREVFSTVREDRLARFVVSSDNANKADENSEQILIAQADRAPNHNGGELLFGPDGYLYLSLGDEGDGQDSFHNGQKIDKNFFSGMLRLDVDRRPGSLPPHPHPAVHAGTYAVPPDNPFVDAKEFNGLPVDPAAVHTEFWAVGLRNPWRFSLDPATGRIWCGDVGQELHEEIDLIVRGGNYGWSFREGAFPFHPDAPAGAKFAEPIWDGPHPEYGCITGGLVYHGKRYPELEGKYIFADYVTGKIMALTPDEDHKVAPDHVKQIATGQTIVSFGRDPRNGDILIASILNESLQRLVHNPAAK